MINQDDLSTAELASIDADSIAGMFSAAFGNLAFCLQEDYEQAIQPLNIAQRDLMREREQVAKAAGGLEVTLPAFARVAERQADALVLEGQPEQAAAQLAEAEAARTAPAKLRARLLEIETRYLEIEDEKRSAARRVVVAWWTNCRKVTRAAEHGFLVTLLGGLEKELAEFRGDTGIEAYSYDLDQGARLSDLLSDDDAVHSIGQRAYPTHFPIAVRATGERR